MTGSESVMRTGLALAVVMFLAGLGCKVPPQGECSRDSDCATGRCDPGVGRCVYQPCTKPSDCGASERCDTAREVCVPLEGTDAGDAGADGGDAGAECNPACAGWGECVEGACLPRYASVNWASPASGTRVGAGPVALAAQLATAAGRSRNDPAELTFGGDGGATVSGTLSRVDAGYYVGAWSAPGEGGYALVARFADAGLSSAPLSLVADRTGPSFTVTVPAAARGCDGGALCEVDPAGGYQAAFKRDELVTVRVSSPGNDVAGGSVRLVVTGLGDGGQPGAAEPPLVVQPDTGCGQPYCGTAQVDLSRPQMRAFRGVMGLAVTGMDDVGNAGGADAGVMVTRWKWSFEVTPAAAPIKTSPAIGTKGTVYFGTVALGSTGTLYALNPDGTFKWAFDAGAVEASPAVGVSDAGVETVFVASTSPTGASVTALSASGALLHSCAQIGGTGAKASVAVGDLAFAGETVVSGVGLINSGGGRLTAIRPDATSVADRCVGNASAGTADFPSTVSMQGAKAYFGDDLGSVQGFAFSGGWTAMTGWPVNANLFTRGLALVGADVVGGGGGPGQGGVFRIPSSGGAVAWKYPTGASAPAWSPAVGSGNEIYFGNQTPVVTKVQLNAASGSTASSTGTVKGAPAIGHDGTVYSGDSSGELATWTASLEKSWSVSGLGNLESSPALDCARGATGAKLAGRPGVLYVGSSTTGKLYSFVVDSRGIDTTAPWPKYQHDPRNTGNADTSLAEFSCPP